MNVVVDYCCYCSMWNLVFRAIDGSLFRQKLPNSIPFNFDPVRWSIFKCWCVRPNSHAVVLGNWRSETVRCHLSADRPLCAILYTRCRHTHSSYCSNSRRRCVDRFNNNSMITTCLLYKILSNTKLSYSCT